MDHFSFKVSINRERVEGAKFKQGNIPTKIFKQSSKSCSDTLHILFNDALRDGNFTDKLN